MDSYDIDMTEAAGYLTSDEELLDRVSSEEGCELYCPGMLALQADAQSECQDLLFERALFGEIDYVEHAAC